MSEIFLKLLNLSIIAGWLVLCIILLRLFLKKLPKGLFLILWGLVGLRLLLPFSIKSVLSLIPSGETVSPDITAAEVPSIKSGLPILNQSVNPVLSEHLTQEKLSGVSLIQVIVSVATYLWLAGAILMLLYMLFSYLRLKKRVRTAVRMQTAQLSENTKLNRIYQCDRIASPFVLGLIHPCIYLPFSLSGQTRDHVIAHERSHIKHLDYLIKPVGFLLLSVYWFNPLLWVAYCLLCRDIELACDERVVKEMGENERADYSESLLVESIPRHLVTACPLAFGEVGVKERVKNVLSYKKPAFYVIILSLLATLAVAICFLTNPKEKQKSGSSELPGCYTVKKILYQAPMYSFGYTEATAPKYEISKEMELLEQNGITGTKQLRFEKLSERTMSAEEFESLFTEKEGDTKSEQFNIKKTGEQLVKTYGTNTSVPMEDGTEVHIRCFVFELQNGDILLAYGYPKESESSKTSTMVRWLFQLSKAEKQEETNNVVTDPFADTEVFVPNGCIYMNPFSSYLPLGGDNGYRYVYSKEDNTFSIINRHSGQKESYEVYLENFRELTDEDFESYFDKTLMKVPDTSVYQKKEILELSNGYLLFYFDQDLFLAKHLNETAGMWSMYSLVKESQLGEAEFLYTPLESSKYPAFPFAFSVSYTEGFFSCENGSLFSFDEPSEKGYPQGASLTLKKGKKLYVSPTLMEETDEETTNEIIVSFSLTVNPSKTLHGSIYIKKDEDSNHYTARVVGTGFTIIQSKEFEGGEISYNVE